MSLDKGQRKYFSFLREICWRNILLRIVLVFLKNYCSGFFLYIDDEMGDFVIGIYFYGGRS